MHTLFLITASVGCTLLLLQVVLQLFGLGHDASDAGALPAADLHAEPHALAPTADAPDVHDHTQHAGQQGQGGFHYLGAALSLKSLSAFAACFGLAGLAAEDASFTALPLALGLATSAGLCGTALVVGLMRTLASLEVSGTHSNSEAVGQSARVYLRIPAAHSGTGIITVQVGGREVEFKALTAGASIPTGAVVEVVRQVDASTFEVVDVESGLTRDQTAGLAAEASDPALPPPGGVAQETQ